MNRKDGRVWVARLNGADSDWGWVDVTSGDYPMILWYGSHTTTLAYGVDLRVCASEWDARALAKEAICIAAAAAAEVGAS